MAPPGRNHKCTRESKRMLGMQSESRCFFWIIGAEAGLQLRDGAGVQPWRGVLCPDVGAHVLLAVSREGDGRRGLCIDWLLVLSLSEGLRAGEGAPHACHVHAVLWVGNVQRLPELFRPGFCKDREVGCGRIGIGEVCDMNR